MSSFDDKARTWDANPMHLKRSTAIAEKITNSISLSKNCNALEYGAGTAILGFLLSDYVGKIDLMDNSSMMLEVAKEKIENLGKTNMKPILFDLEENDFEDQNYDLIANQMVMHHVKNVKKIFTSFYKLLNQNGHLVIADLYPEDGSFHHGEEGLHHGFDPSLLAKDLISIGFKNVSYEKVFEIQREVGGTSRTYPVFILFAQK